jgi:hypothetical protein
MPQAAARSKRSARLTSKKWKCDVTPTATSPSFTTVSARSRASHSIAASACGGGPDAPIGSCSTSSRLPSANSASTSTRRTSAATPPATSPGPSSA